MFFRRKLSGRTEYLQIVKNDRVDGRPRQSVVATLGRVDELGQAGTLERLLRSGARFAHSAVVLTAYEKGEATAIATRQLGPALAFERLWRETGCKQVISALAAEREFQFDLERAVSCIACSIPARTAQRRSGGTAWSLTGSPASICTSSTGRWAGLATNWPTRADAALVRALPRISSRSSCSPCATNCSAS